MAVTARMKSTAGSKAPPTIASAATLRLPEDGNVFLVSGTTAVTSLVSLTTGSSWPGRTVTFIGTDASGNDFTNTNDPTTAGQMDLGGSNRTLAAQDVLVLIQATNGTWVMQSFTNN